MPLVFARPQSSGELLDVAVAMVRRHLGGLLLLGALPIALALAADLVLRLAGAGPNADLLSTLPVLVCFGIAEARMIAGAWQLFHGQPIGAREVRAQVRARRWSVISGYTLKWVLILVGFVLLVAPGVFVLLLLFAVPTATVLEDRDMWSSIRRSRLLARGNMKRLFATVGLFDLAASAFTIGMEAVFSDRATGQLPTWAALTNWAVTIVLMPLRATLMVAVYADIRIRQEGYDVESAAMDLRGAA